MKGHVVNLLVVLVMSCTVLEPCQALTCGVVVSSLKPCFNYLSGQGEATAQCCSGVNNLNGLADSTAKRRTACNCMKAIAERTKGLQYDFISQLPRRAVPGFLSSSTSTDVTRFHEHLIVTGFHEHSMT